MRNIIVESGGLVGNCELVQNDAVRPDIDCLRNHSFRVNFGGLIAQSTDTKLHVSIIVAFLNLVTKTEIDYLDLLLVVQQDVLQLQVLVNDPLLMKVENRLQDLLRPCFKFQLV